MNSKSLVTFPAASFRSMAEFHQFRADNRDLFDERYRRERMLAIDGPAIATEGVCGPCIRVTQFTSPTHGGEKLSDDRWVPRWRLGQHCGCQFELTSCERAAVHAAIQYLGQPSWYCGGVLGRAERLAAYLQQSYPTFDFWPRMLRTAAGDLCLPVAPASQHMVLSSDDLPHFPALDRALTAIAQALLPGGVFIFSAPLDVEAEQTVSHLGSDGEDERSLAVYSAHPVHRLGWDIIARLHNAGFEDAVAQYYWSEELGYLGPYNMIFVASR